MNYEASKKWEQNESIMSLKRDAESIFYAGVKAVDPFEAVKRYVRRKEDVLTIAGQRYFLNKLNRVLIVGFGKAGFPMARAMEDILGNRISQGIVVVKEGYGGVLKRVKIVESSHPIPGEAGLRAGKEIVFLLEQVEENDLVICLISGGGSAILPAPVEGISLKEKQKVTQLLLECGASIEEINTIRKHISLIKGGQLARLSFPAHLHSLILSDVVEDRLDTIASGPTTPDNTIYRDCWEIIKKYNLKSQLPASVVIHLQKGLEGKIKETPKLKDLIFNKVNNLIIGSNILALKSAKKKAQNLGYNTLILSSCIQGETREVAKFEVAVAKEIIRSSNPLSSPACILSGGETTVKVKGKGKGGRCQELVLAACTEMKKLENILFLCAGTDGTDGPTDAAGAFASSTTWVQAQTAGLSPVEFLENNDSYTFFKKIGDLFVTSPTNTNVMDLHIILIKRD